MWSFNCGVWLHFSHLMHKKMGHKYSITENSTSLQEMTLRFNSNSNSSSSVFRDSSLWSRVHISKEYSEASYLHSPSEGRTWGETRTLIPFDVPYMKEHRCLLAFCLCLDHGPGEGHTDIFVIRTHMMNWTEQAWTLCGEIRTECQDKILTVSSYYMRRAHQ